MEDETSAYYELRFRTQFLESKGAAFQDLFASIMCKAHPEDFVPCRPWGNVGDRKNDGYLKSARMLFQVYAPNDMKLAQAIKKIESDFHGALPHWQDYFDTWVFVHNAPDGLSAGIIQKLLELQRDHAPIQIVHWGFDELLLKLRKLGLDSLSLMFGSLPAGRQPKPKSEIRTKLDLAQELIRQGKRSEAIKEMTGALSLAEAHGNEEEEVEVLVALALTSSDRRSRSDRQHYFQRAAAKVDKLKSAAAKVIFYRAKAAALDESRDMVGAEEAHREALRLCSEQDDEKGNLARQGCVVRSSFVHFLCNQKRVEEAEAPIHEALEYARAHPDEEDGELLQAALEAHIHFSLESGDEDGAIESIVEMEQAANTVRLADRLGGELVDIANRASHRDAHRTALAAAQGAVRLGRRAAELSPSFLPGALYTEAMVIFRGGDADLGLAKAQAVLALCQGADDAAIRGAAQHLIGEIRRTSGDSQAAVDLARMALASAGNGPEEVSYTKFALARALNDNGQTEEALQHVKEAWALMEPCDLPPQAAIDVLSAMANYASQLGADEDLLRALEAISRVPASSDEVAEEKSLASARVKANMSLRERLVEVITSEDPAKAADTEMYESLGDANAAVVQPLLELWDSFDDRTADCLGGMYDFWGRGNFGRLLLNAKRFQRSFNITLEVRSLDDVKRAVRLWGLYADFLILLWKGPTDNGMAVVPFPDDYEAPGGWGYMIAAGTVLKKEGSSKTWYPAMGHISMFPHEVVTFLATEARPFLEAGRLIIVPAVGAGCINPGHGPFEQLLAEAANAIPNVRWKGIEGTPIGFVPHSPDAPLHLLAELAQSEEGRLRKLRLLLLRRSQQLRPDGDADVESKLLAMEIEDALRDFADRNSAFAERQGTTQAKEPLLGSTAPFKADGARVSDTDADTPFAPLFLLQSLGYGWRVDSPNVPRFPPRFQPAQGDVVGTWLAPPSAGWAIPTVRAVT